MFVERKRWRRKERALRVENENLRRTVDSYKEELRKLKEECYVSAFLEVVDDAEEGTAKAVLLLDQVKNYKKKKPRWSELTIRHGIVMRHLSTKAYQYLRSEELLKLPCRTTLQKYFGSTSGQVGFSQLVRSRLEAELETLDTPQSKVCSLVVDETRIKQKLTYNKQRDAFVGDVDLGPELEHLAPASDGENLANSLLCFLLCGLHSRYKIPAGYFFTKGCTGEQLAEVIRHVVIKTASIGFDIVRVVTDNHKINVNAMDILSGGEAKIQAPHPADPSKDIYFAFDQSHVIKNTRSQFLAKKFGENREVSSKYIKMLYKMQRHSTMRPIRFLTRKHVFPSNIEKMNVMTAVQLFSATVIAALKYLRDQAGHSCDMEFASVGPTVEFMEAIHKWFMCMDVSNLQQHIHRSDEDARQFSDTDDPRLEWLEGEFLFYIEQLKTKSRAENYLSKETHHALLFTTMSNVGCIRFLLSQKNFQFVLTRKFSSDPIESMLGFLRRSAGCNDALDVKSAVCGIEKMLKTGIIASTPQSNVRSSTSFSSAQLLPGHQTAPKTTGTAESVLNAAVYRLKEQCLSDTPCASNPGVASVAMVGGFIVRAATENIPCAECIALLQGTKANTPLLGLIAHQDRGGLMYPSQELIKLLTYLRRFVDSVLPHRKCFPKPLKMCVERTVEVLVELPFLRCSSTDTDQRRRLMQLIATKFIKPLFSNYALGTTDRHATVKLLQRKPISRKVLKM
ncbi:hypothetical protein MTO96_042785 [Rhipicephalus appendiculatus]